MTQAHPWRYFRTVIIARAFSACWTVAGTVVQQPLVQFFNSHWHEYSTVAGTILQHSLARFFNSHWHDSSTVIGTIIQQSLARLFNSHWHDCSTVAGTIVQHSLTQLCNSGWHEYSTVAGTSIQQSLTRLFNGHWHDCSTVTGTIIQQSLARLFNSRWHDSPTVAVKIFSFFYADRILQQCWRIVPCTRNTTQDPLDIFNFKLVLGKQSLCGILKIAFRILDSNSCKIALNDYLRGAWNFAFSGILSRSQHDAF